MDMIITVKDLIEILNTCDKNCIVKIGYNENLTNVTECIKENRVSLWSENEK